MIIFFDFQYLQDILCLKKYTVVFSANLIGNATASAPHQHPASTHISVVSCTPYLFIIMDSEENRQPGLKPEGIRVVAKKACVDQEA